MEERKEACKYCNSRYKNIAQHLHNNHSLKQNKDGSFTKGNKSCVEMPKDEIRAW